MNQPLQKGAPQDSSDKDGVCHEKNPIDNLEIVHIGYFGSKG